MPTALATTKRKLHKLLDSISNASTPSLVPQDNGKPTNNSTTTLPANFAPPSKRLRVERPKSAYIPPSQRPEFQKTRPASLLPQPNRPISTPTKEDRKPPNFAPWDRNQFLDRLKTFRHVDKWLGKPDRINEVEWAKRGWSCVGKETLRCLGGCEACIVVKLEEDHVDRESRDRGEVEGQAEKEGDGDGEDDEQEWREEAQKELVKRYAEMISSAHEGSCLWRRRGCDDTIQRLPLIHPTTALNSLRERYTSLTAMTSALPPETIFTTPEGLNLSKLIAQAEPLLKTPPTTSPPSSSSSPSSPSKIHTPSLLLSLFGWTPEENGHLPGLVTCPACFRRLGLWLFTPPPTSPDANWEQSSPLSRLDVVAEHREYCPWINALSQNGGARRTSLDSLCGWEVLVRAVRNAASRRRADEEEEEGRRRRKEGGMGKEGDERSEVVSLTAEEESARDEDRKSRLRRLKQVFTVKKKAGDRKSVGV